jgi:hypothetical protein
MACFPTGKEIIAVRELLVLFAFCTESIYMIIAVTVCSLSSAAALKVTGELTVAPFRGAQIFTVLSIVAVQVCAEALLAKTKETKRRAAAENARKEITRGPYTEIQNAFINAKLACVYLRVYLSGLNQQVASGLHYVSCFPATLIQLCFGHF